MSCAETTHVEICITLTITPSNFASRNVFRPDFLEGVSWVDLITDVT